MFEELVKPYWVLIEKAWKESESKQEHHEKLQEKIANELGNVNYMLTKILETLKAKR